MSISLAMLPCRKERNIDACHIADLSHSRAKDSEIIELAREYRA